MTSGVCWHEWSAEKGVDLEDRTVWQKTNPALHGRLLVSVVEGERANMSDSGFARERLGMWDEASTNRVIDSATWAACADELSQPTARLALAVDVNPDRSTASVALAGHRSDGKWHVELDEERNGVGWLAPYVVQRCERNDIRAVVIDQASPAASMIDPLKSHKIKVTATGPRDMGQACGMFYDGAMEGWLRHIDQPQLNLALSVARKRALGDAWAWNRKNADSDITPLVACTLALWGAQSSAVKKPSRSRSGERRAVLL